MKTSLSLFPFVLIFFTSPLHSQNCLNSDFESSTATIVTTSTQVSGWTVTEGNHAQTPGSNNCNLTACCPGNPLASAVIDASAGFTDPNIGPVYPIYSVFGTVAGHTNASVMNPSIGVTMTGTNVFRLNSNMVGPPRLERLSKTLSVTPTNCIFDIAHMCVFSRGHDCCNAPQLLVTINNFTCPLIHVVGNAINPCPDSNIGVTFYTSGTTTVASPTNGLVYTKWDIKSLDLSAYMGQTVTVNFTASHCTAGGHYVAAYLDTRCGPAILVVNNTTMNLGPVTTTACSSAATATITAPPFFNSYQWIGPSGFTASTAVINTTLAGTYTLSFGNVGSCSMSTKTITIVIGQPTVNVSTNYTLSCAKNPVVLTASALANYSWSTGSTSPSITVSPSVTTVYTLTGKNSSGCTASASFTQNVTPCTGLDSYGQNNNALKVFPNPNRGEFTVLVEKELNAEFVLENSLGQIVHTQHILRGENKIKTAGLADGIYYYRVMNGERKLVGGKVQLRH